MEIGFYYKKTMKEIDNIELAAVYFPHSYNFSGELYLLPSERVQFIDMPSAEVMKFIVSGGITRFGSNESYTNLQDEIKK